MMGGGSSASRILIRTRGKVTSRSGDEKLLKYGVCRPASLPKSGETYFSEKWGNIICFLQYFIEVKQVIQCNSIYILFFNDVTVLCS